MSVRVSFIEENGLTLFFQATPEGKLVEVSSLISALTGLTDESQETLQAAFQQVCSQGRPVECTISLKGVERQLQISLTSATSPTTEAERRLNEAQRVAQIGSWEFEIETGVISWSPETFRLFGFDPALGEPDYPSHLNRHHPEDRARLAQAVEQAITQGTPYDLELRVVLESGELRWMHCLGTVARNTDGKIVRLLGTSQDITERKLREHMVEEMLELMPHIAFLIDVQGHVHLYNGYFYAFTGIPRQLPPAEVRWQHFLLEEELPRLQELVGTLTTRTEPFEFEVSLRRADGERRWHLMRVVPVVGGATRQRRFIVTGTDIAERRTQEEALHQSNSHLAALATTDALTGVGNRRALDERLLAEWERAHRYQHPLSVILLDVDHFKSYNDTFGHSQGDDVLRRLGGLLIANMRKADFVARYGGEEFLVVLPHTEGEPALVWAERLRELIENLPWPLRTITASFGVATWQPDPAETTLESLSAAADTALYRAKRTRNCVCHYDLAVE